MMGSNNWFFSYFVVLKKTVFVFATVWHLLAARVFCDSLGALTNSVFGQLTGQKKTHGSLGFPRRHGLFAVVGAQLLAFSADSVEQIVDETVHDRHSSGSQTNVWVHLFQHLVDVDIVRLFSSYSPLFVASRTDLASLLASSLLSLLRYLASVSHCLWVWYMFTRWKFGINATNFRF